MPIENIHTYLVYPNKGVEDAAPITGNAVPQEGKMFSLLNEIYDRAETECSIGIAFRQAEDGQQENPCRTLLVDYVTAPDIEKGRSLAERLAGVTTKRSGLGLMFLIRGKEGSDHKVVVSRFRANNGVLVDEAAEELTVEFIDRVFMKNAHSYKAVAYRHASLAAGFWSGIAVDKQINSRDAETSDYWVKEFLASDLLTTPALGTRRLALALKDAVKSTKDLDVKQKITAAATLASGINGQSTSAETFFDRYGFDERTAEVVRSQFSRSDLAAETFVFSGDEFARVLPYKSIELDSGAVLTAESAKFNDIFSIEPVDGSEDETRFSTTGKIVSEKLAKTR
ncbi:hypothetical protein SAMN06297251_10180 [Fulvimarina manganoxydans]|uniref:Nucleoid-associated protein n=1 Tax=Fulvimarina manganoxydans TaxID=937218 RepID=A0A1W1Y9E1_9HYPH|nr:hypothetical protein [Fulvimarina manganoxydans]SMC32749.1 hypothetical protein SAMN06297251_10180 [Fulvimarina manganoxydans]